MQFYKTKSPVLLLLFNRLEYTKLVFEEVRKARPDKLYVAIDGPRINNDEDQIKIVSIKDFIYSHIDWDCKVETLFRDQNLGCKDAVSSAITWFFDNESKGIILEDDCLPLNSFFSFCDQLLDKYEFDERVRHISGVCFLNTEVDIEASYYFSKFTHVWGWASWKRVWKDYSKDIFSNQELNFSEILYDIYPDKNICDSIGKEFKRVQEGDLNTWDYQYLFLNFINSGLTIIPKSSLIKNIGFDSDSTHTHSNPYNSRELNNIDHITHPKYIIPSLRNDILSLDEMFKTKLLDKLFSHILSFKSKF